MPIKFNPAAIPGIIIDAVAVITQDVAPHVKTYITDAQAIMAAPDLPSKESAIMQLVKDILANSAADVTDPAVQKLVAEVIAALA